MRRLLPSTRVALYLARTFLLRSLAVLAALVLILATLDVLGNAGEVLAPPQNGDAELWRYVGLRVPQLIQRFLPFSVLLGTLITLAVMNQNSEVVAMKAAGISAHQIIAPLMLASLVLAAASFVFNERIVTRATAALNAWEAADYGPVPRDTGIRSNIWVHRGDDLVRVNVVSGAGADLRLRGVTVYERAGGTLQRIIRGDQGILNGSNLELTGTRSFDLETGGEQRAEVARLPLNLAPEQFTLARVDPAEQDFWTLENSIRQLEIAGRDTVSLQGNLWHKIAGPLSSVLMPLLAAVAAFGLARSGQLFIRAVIGMLLGFAYFVVDNFALAMGNLGAYPPLLAAWGPFLLFLMIGEAVLIRTEE